MLEGTLIWKIEHISLILQPFLSGDYIPLVNKIQIESNKFQDNLLTETMIFSVNMRTFRIGILPISPGLIVILIFIFVCYLV